MQSILSHPALVSIPAAVAVIIATAMFLRELRAMGRSRDLEREAFLDALTQMCVSRDADSKAFSDAIIRLVSLAQTMVDRCQRGVTPDQKVTPKTVIEATRKKG